MGVWDICAASDMVGCLVCVTGHSAGGLFSLWAGCRRLFCVLREDSHVSVLAGGISHQQSSGRCAGPPGNGDSHRTLPSTAIHLPPIDPCI